MIDKDLIGKDSIGKDSIGKDPINKDPDLGNARECWQYLSPSTGLRDRTLVAFDREFSHPRIAWTRLLAFAAAVVLLAGAAAIYATRPHLHAPAGIAVKPMPAARQSARSVEAAARAPQPSRHAARHVPQEIVTEFYPLIYAPPPLVNGTLMRVTVSATAMQLAGLPVREEQLDQNIQADLLLGDDGTARAIRFVGIEKGKLP
jgi:hypothetical protein